jgi:FkbM family methyltransferase
MPRSGDVPAMGRTHGVSVVPVLRVADGARRALSCVWRLVPRHLRVRSVYLRGLNRALLAAGASPVAIARMRLGHRLRLDLRSGTEWFAYYTGEFDDRRITTAQRLLRRPGGVVVDAGANIGFWSVPLARHLAGMGGRLLAVEPVPANAARLRDNLRLNGVDGLAEVTQVALSDRPGRASLTLREDFHDDGAATGNAAILIGDEDDRRYERVDVETTRLDDLLADHGNPPVRLVKADLEGHEDRFLAGAAGTLGRCRPVVVIEWNDIYYRRRGVDATADVSRLLAQHDYRCLRFAAGAWFTTTGFASPRPVDDLLLVPAEEVAGLLPGLRLW